MKKKLIMLLLALSLYGCDHDAIRYENGKLVFVKYRKKYSESDSIERGWKKYSESDSIERGWKKLSVEDSLRMELRNAQSNNSDLKTAATVYWLFF